MYLKDIERSSKMKLKQILIFSMLLLISASCTSPLNKKEVSPSIASTEKALNEKDSFTADYSEETINGLNSEKVSLTNTATLSVGSKDSAFSTMTLLRPSGAEEIPDSKQTIYTLLNPKNSKEIIEYTNQDPNTTWQERTMPLPWENNKTYSDNALYLHERLWTPIRTFKDRFTRSDKMSDVDGKKAVSFQAVLLKEDLEKDIDPALKKNLSSVSYDKLTITLWSDPDSSLPLKIEMQSELTIGEEKIPSSSKETLVYTSFDPVKETLPEDIATE